MTFLHWLMTREAEWCGGDRVCGGQTTPGEFRVGHLLLCGWAASHEGSLSSGIMSRFKPSQRRCELVIY